MSGIDLYKGLKILVKQITRRCGYAIALLTLLRGFATPLTLSDHVSALTATVSVPRSSLFADDTCSPPCWFGLTPGESTAENVIEMFQAHRDLFLVNPEPGPELHLVAENFDALFTGESATFLWKSWNRRGMTDSKIEITDGVITSIDVVMNEIVSLDETLETLGQPTYVLGLADLSNVLSLFYTDQNVIVNLDAGIESCVIKTILADFTVDSLYYYAPEIFENVQEIYAGYLHVSPEAWREWQTEPEELSCALAIGRQETLFVVSTLTPSP